MADEELIPLTDQQGRKQDENGSGKMKALLDQLLTAVKEDNDDFYRQIYENAKRDGNLETILSQFPEKERTKILQIAARHDNLQRLSDILSQFDINAVDERGETALHVAAEGGSFEAVQILLSHHADVDARDNRGCSPLHSAFRSRAPKVEVIVLLVHELSSKSAKADEAGPADQRWSYGQVDHFGNTPLHVAAIYMCTKLEDCVRCVQQLNGFDANRTNKTGDSAFHVAAKRRNSVVLEAMLHVFYRFEKDVDGHVRDKDGDSLLDICSLRGDGEMATLLLDYGADPRDGLLHKIVSESLRKPAKTGDLRSIYNLIIVDNVDKWNSNSSSSSGAELEASGRDGIVNLLNRCSDDHDGKNAVEFAVDEGAVHMLTEFVQTEALYEYREDGSYRFRVKNCTPSIGRISLLERIVNFGKEDVGAEMIFIQPLRHISSLYLWYSTLLYSILFTCQLIYMIGLSLNCVPDVCQLSFHFNMSNVTGCDPGDAIASEQVLRKLGLYVIWPLAVVIGTICFPFCQCKGFVFMRLLDITANLFSLVFGVIIVIWYAILIQGEYYQLYTEVTAILFIYGWFQAFRYLSYLGEMYIFTSLVKEMIVKDVSRFAFLLMFLIAGFSLALQALNQTMLVQVPSRELSETMYFTFTAILGMGPLFDDTVDGSNFDEAHGNIYFLRIVFVAYVIVASLILLNILIAMMSDTYHSSNTNAKAVWKYNVLKDSLALMIVKPKFTEDPLVPESIAGAIIRSLPDGDNSSESPLVAMCCEGKSFFKRKVVSICQDVKKEF